MRASLPPDSPLPRPSTRLRVAAVIDTSIISGPGRQLAALVPPLNERGIDIRILTFQHKAEEKTPFRRFLEDLGLDHRVIPFRKRLDFGMIGAMRNELMDLRPHLVQTHSYRPSVFVRWLRFKGASWKWIGFYHGTTNEDLKVGFYHWLDRRVLRSSDQIVVMSKEQAATYFAGVDGKVRQVWNAVLPVPEPSPSPQLEAALRELPDPIIGFIGRLSHEKGIDVALRTLRVLHDGGSTPSMVVAGDGPEMVSAQSLTQRLGLSSSVRFLGHVDPIEPLYPKLDLLLISSRSEGLPNVLLEALRHDVPVVSTRVGAVPDVLENTKAGRMAPPESPEELAEQVQLGLAEARDESVVMAREAVARAFSLDNRVQVHADLYHQVLGSPAP